MQNIIKTNVSAHVKKNIACQKKHNDYGFPKTLKIVGKTTFSAIRRLPFTCQEKHKTTRAPQKSMETMGNHWFSQGPRCMSAGRFRTSLGRQ